jgi:DNA-directed RNA polymerase subunit RPC12/RpoP
VRVDIPCLDGATYPDAPTGGNFSDYDYYCPHCDVMVGWMGAGNHLHCPKCGSPPKEHSVENYDAMWHDGDVVCGKCRTRVRGWDAG